MASSKITRRQLLRAMAGTAGALLLASCAPSQPTSPKAEPTKAGAQPAPPKEVKLVVWTQAGSTDNLRAENAVPAAKALNEALQKSGQNVTIVVEPVVDTASWGDYKKKYALAADAGQAPDIVVAGHEDCAVWAEPGYIVPLDDCIKSQKEFEDVIPRLWDSMVYKGKKWAVPCDTEARPMFFSIDRFKAFGWSDAQIAELPKRIEKGEFTLDDMIATAKEAIAKGVVEKGYGYWHRTTKGGDFLQYYHAYGGRIYDDKSGKLVTNKAAMKEFFAFQRRCVTEGITPANYIGTEGKIWHDAVSHNKVLFFNGGVWHWSDWAANYVKDIGGRDYLQKNIGFALQPSGKKGTPGATLSHPLIYMVSSKKATGKENQDLACQLLAKMTTTELANAHSIRSTHLAILKSQLDSPAYKAEHILTGTAYMANFAFYQPNHASFGIWWDIAFKGMQDAENGVKPVDQAVEEVIKQQQAELGDQLLVE